MRVILDARALRLYPVGREGFTGATELYLKQVAHGLAARGHVVNVVTPDLTDCEQRGPSEFWWPPEGQPCWADAVVMFHSLEHVEPYHADLLVLATNGVDPPVQNMNMLEAVDAFPVFSEYHAERLMAHRPTVQREKCFVTGLGVDLGLYGFDGKRGIYGGVKEGAVLGRMLWGNDPTHGLWHTLDIYERVRKTVPDASLHITYDFDRQFEGHRWGADLLSEYLWDCKRRIETLPGVESLGALSREDVVREQLECQVYALANESRSESTMLHGVFQMECAAAGVPLVLSDNPGYREVFGEAAEILPLPGTFVPDAERRVDAQDWADKVIELMCDEKKWAEASARSHALAEKHSWAAVVDRWESMFAVLRGEVEVAA